MASTASPLMISLPGFTGARVSGMGRSPWVGEAPGLGRRLVHHSVDSRGIVGGGAGIRKGAAQPSGPAQLDHNSRSFGDLRTSWEKEPCRSASRPGTFDG